MVGVDIDKTHTHLLVPEHSKGPFFATPTGSTKRRREGANTLVKREPGEERAKARTLFFANEHKTSAP